LSPVLDDWHGGRTSAARGFCNTLIACDLTRVLK
jgi:hypothetical protein